MAGSGDRIYHYNYFDTNAYLFGGISIFEFIPNTFELNQWVFATRGSWEGSHWILEDGWVRRMDLKGISRLLRSEEHTSELQSQSNLVCRLLLEKKKQ